MRVQVDAEVFLGARGWVASIKHARAYLYALQHGRLPRAHVSNDTGSPSGTIDPAPQIKS